MRTIDVNILKNYVQYLAAKDVAGGYIPPDRWNEMLPIVVNKIVRKYYGPPEEYQPGMPLPKISYEITQLVSDYISQLKVEAVLVISANGKSTKPSDYLHYSSLAVNKFISFTEEEKKDIEERKVLSRCCKTVQGKMEQSLNMVHSTWRPVTVVPEKNRWAYLDSSLRKPTVRYPIAVFLGSDAIQFYPENLVAAHLTYIRYPLTAKWGYTITGGIPVYDSATSVNVELPEICADELAVSILDRLGITIRERELVDWSRYIKERGT